MTQKQVVVIGGAGVDMTGQALAPLLPQVSNPGFIRQGFGGVGRNIAENLGRLGVPVLLFSVLGQDERGQALAAYTAQAGVDMSAIKWCADVGTAGYLSLLNPDGDLAWAVSDYQIMAHFSPADLQARRPLLAGAAFLVIDLNLSEAVLEAALALAYELGVAVAVDPTSSAKVASLRPYLAGLTLITPNAKEAQILSGQPIHDSASALQAAVYLHKTGVKQVVITLGAAGVVYVSAEGQGACLAPHAEILDTTGAGDALTAGLIFGLLEGQPLAQAIRCGLRAAQLTLACRTSVNPALNAALLRVALAH